MKTSYEIWIEGLKARKPVIRKQASRPLSFGVWLGTVCQQGMHKQAADLPQQQPAPPATVPQPQKKSWTDYVPDVFKFDWNLKGITNKDAWKTDTWGQVDKLLNPITNRYVENHVRQPIVNSVKRVGQSWKNYLTGNFDIDASDQTFNILDPTRYHTDPTTNKSVMNSDEERQAAMELKPLYDAGTKAWREANNMSIGDLKDYIKEYEYHASQMPGWEQIKERPEAASYVLQHFGGDMKRATDFMRLYGLRGSSKGAEAYRRHIRNQAIAAQGVGLVNGINPFFDIDNEKRLNEVGKYIGGVEGRSVRDLANAQNLVGKYITYRGMPALMTRGAWALHGFNNPAAKYGADMLRAMGHAAGSTPMLALSAAGQMDINENGDNAAVTSQILEPLYHNGIKYAWDNPLQDRFVKNMPGQRLRRFLSYPIVGDVSYQAADAAALGGIGLVGDWGMSKLRGAAPGVFGGSINIGSPEAQAAKRDYAFFDYARKAGVKPISSQAEWDAMTDEQKATYREKLVELDEKFPYRHVDAAVKAIKDKEKNGVPNLAFRHKEFKAMLTTVDEVPADFWKSEEFMSLTPEQRADLCTRRIKFAMAQDWRNRPDASDSAFVDGIKTFFSGKGMDDFVKASANRGSSSFAFQEMRNMMPSMLDARIDQSIAANASGTPITQGMSNEAVQLMRAVSKYGTPEQRADVYGAFDSIETAKLKQWLSTCGGGIDPGMDSLLTDSDVRSDIVQHSLLPRLADDKAVAELLPALVTMNTNGAKMSPGVQALTKEMLPYLMAKDFTGVGKLMDTQSLSTCADTLLANKDNPEFIAACGGQEGYDALVQHVKSGVQSGFTKKALMNPGMWGEAAGLFMKMHGMPGMGQFFMNNPVAFWLILIGVLGIGGTILGGVLGGGDDDDDDDDDEAQSRSRQGGPGFDALSFSEG